MRPHLFDDLVGQEKIWAAGSSLRRLIEADRFTALLFWGPSGSGKTSLARLIGNHGHRPVAWLSAVTHGVKDIRDVLAESEGRIAVKEPEILMFMDEIHRLNRGQQDVLLPALERGVVRFIGATTENPSFEVNAAVLSRAIVFRFEKLAPPALLRILERTLADPAAALERRDLTPEVLTAIAQAADGDARRALNLLDAVVASAPPERAPVDLACLAEARMEFALNYDKQGDQHYDTASAFIKSIRASQPDAALHYLARMLAGGEDPVFIARRLVIAASEDIGNANPTAALLATAAMQAVHMVGMPEARIILGQATTYLAASPKSNRSYVAINEAIADVEKFGGLSVPMHLRNAPTKLMKEFGYGKGYVYAHDDQTGAQNLDYLPVELRGRRYYHPSDNGTEVQLKRNLEQLQQRQKKPSAQPSDEANAT